jgi:hypothetical protein
MQETIAFKNRKQFIQFIFQSFILANINYFEWLDWVKCNRN